MFYVFELTFLVIVEAPPATQAPPPATQAPPATQPPPPIQAPAIPIEDLVKGMAGVWKLSYTNKYKDQIEIRPNGKIVIKSHPKRKVHLQASNNQVEFPSSEGWLMATKNYRKGTWEYYRLRKDGTLEIQHFCNDMCRGKYKSLHFYCCVGTGVKQGMFIMKLSVNTWSY